MKPTEFVLWLNGAAELVGDQPPTPEQWATMREKLGEAVGGLVAARLLERVEETLRADEKEKAEKNEAMKQMLESLKIQRAAGSAPEVTGYQLKVNDYANKVELVQRQMEAYRAQVDTKARKLFGLARALPEVPKLEVPEVPKLEVPEVPKPHNPGLLNRILGKATT